ncbi:MAG: preprotein translocase subunit SecE [Synergistaceae bacterium]|nr:preprotein translocase subunit SecE [Synergistaceae bacterium]
MSALGFIKESRAEMKKVTWPTKRMLWYMTLVVVFVSLLVAAYLGLCDALLTAVVTHIIK